MLDKPGELVSVQGIIILVIRRIVFGLIIHNGTYPYLEFNVYHGSGFLGKTVFRKGFTRSICFSNNLEQCQCNSGVYEINCELNHFNLHLFTTNNFKLKHQNRNVIHPFQCKSDFSRSALPTDRYTHDNGTSNSMN